MRLGIIPEGFIDCIALASGKMPTPLVKSFWGVALGRTLIAGTRLGVFEVLSEGEKTAEEVAQDIGCNPEGMETLLNALNGFGYLKRRNGRYSITKQTAKWLIESSSSSIRDAIMFLFELWNDFSDIERAVKSGKIKDFHFRDRPPEFWEHYIRGLATFARYNGPEIVRKVSPIKKPRRLLDVGGGHGMYSIAFCRKYPDLQVEVLDLPGAVIQGKRIVKEQGFQDKIQFREGDLRVTEWGDDYDIILLFNIIHNVSYKEAPEIFIKAYQALNSYGLVVLLDSEHVGGEKDLSTTSGFNELLFFVINGCRIYPEETIRKWIFEAGFTNLKKRKLLTLPMTLFLTGYK